VLGHFPGIQVVMPATPADAKGLLVSALRSSAPTVVLEHRALFETQGVVPEDLTPVPIGKAAIAKSGSDVTIAATSMMVREALRAASGLSAVGVNAEVVDIRSIRPIDKETIVGSVRKTGRIVIADTSWVTYGVAAEIAAIVSEDAFDDLKAPVRRLGMADVPAPVSRPLEDAFYSDAEDIAKACLALLNRDDAEVSIPTDIGAEFLGPY
jgi:pyruvate dehydrogenase E1 component beta subunit